MGGGWERGEGVITIFCGFVPSHLKDLGFHNGRPVSWRYFCTVLPTGGFALLLRD
jgi:hypothetical protein